MKILPGLILVVVAAMMLLATDTHSFVLSPPPPPYVFATRRRVTATVSSSSSSSRIVPRMTKQEATTTTATTTDDTTTATATTSTTTTTLTVTLQEHRPMGCTVEESLAGGHHVFVTKVVVNGNAGKAGLRPGDVITGVTGLFGEIEDVTGLGIDKVKSLVASRPDNEVLELTVLRGSTIPAEHEKAVVELCTNPDADDAVDQCVLEYLQGGYHPDTTTTSSSSSNLDENEVLCENEDECLVDDLYNLWAQDLPGPETGKHDGELDTDDDDEAAIKPWSSRASPSGTYVRDPVTGEMKDID